MEQREDDHADDQHYRNQEQQPPNDVGNHSRAPICTDVASRVPSPLAAATSGEALPRADPTYGLPLFEPGVRKLGLDLEVRRLEDVLDTRRQWRDAVVVDQLDRGRIPVPEL